MSSNYNYISVSSDSELMTAYIKAMSDQTTDEFIKVEMAKCSLSRFSEVAKTMRQICDSNIEVHNLVNSLIKQTRTQQYFEKQKSGQDTYFYYKPIE